MVSRVYLGDFGDHGKSRESSGDLGKSRESSGEGRTFGQITKTDFDKFVRRLLARARLQSLKSRESKSKSLKSYKTLNCDKTLESYKTLNRDKTLRPMSKTLGRKMIKYIDILERMFDRGFSYSKVLSIFLDSYVSRNGADMEKRKKIDVTNDPRHEALYRFFTNIRGYRGLFRIPCDHLYTETRIDEVWHLYASKDLDDYVQFYREKHGGSPTRSLSRNSRSLSRNSHKFALDDKFALEKVLKPKCEIVGEGGSGKVLTLDCIAHKKITMIQYDGRENGDTLTIDQVAAVLSNHLVKSNKNDESTFDEIRRNTKVHAWLAPLKFIHYTSLDPKYSHLMTWKSHNSQNSYMKPYIVNKKMKGDIRHLRLTTLEFAELLRVHLVVLYHLHKNKYLHQDIKPDNVLYDSDALSLKRTFYVHDFGIMHSFDHVFENMMEELYSGTPGYLSPLMTVGDSDNDKAVQAFCDVANKGGARGKQDMRSMKEFFVLKRHEIVRGRKIHDLVKLDLNSLGLTVWSLLKDSLVPDGRERDLLTFFVDRLLFFDSTSFATAYDALKTLCVEFEGGGLCDELFTE